MRVFNASYELQRIHDEQQKEKVKRRISLASCEVNGDLRLVLLLGGVGGLLLSLGFYSGVDCGIAGFFGNVIYVSDFFFFIGRRTVF